MRSVVFLVIMFFSTFAFGECLDHAFTQEAMNRCASMEYQKLDAKLMRIYNSLSLKRPNDKKYQKLISDIKKEWIEFRELQTQLIYWDQNGSVRPMCEHNYRRDMTKAQISGILTLTDNDKENVCAV